MLRSSKRSLYTVPDDTTSKSATKYPKRLHHARKYASIQPTSPSKKVIATKFGKPHKAEDFLEFLCVRHLPALPSDLDVFMEPPGTQQKFFSDDDSDDEIPLAQALRLGKETEKRTVTKSPPNKPNSKVKDGKCDRNEWYSIGRTELCSSVSLNRVDIRDVVTNDPVDKTCDSSVSMKLVNTGLLEKDDAPLPPRSITNSLANGSPSEVKNIDCISIKLPEQKDFFKCMQDIRDSQGALALVSPPENVKVVSYVLHDINLTIRTKHIHRLKHSHGKSFMTSSAIMKQLERESVPIKELPKIGLCEVDLPMLRDVVNSFGGIECINRDQCWKLVADNMSIPKTASRRMQQIETIYLKYILPFETLPAEDQMHLRQSVLSSSVNEIWPVENVCQKKINLAIFKKMVDSYSSMYCKGVSLSTETVEELFWEIVNKGERHACGAYGEVDLLDEPKDYENNKLTVCWRMHNISSLERSALKYFGLCSKLTVPWLLFEGIFNTCKWSKQEFGLSTISYLHRGADRIWYVIPQEDSEQFESLRDQFSDLVTPVELNANGCNVRRCIQKEGQYAIVQGNCYYCTIATGYCTSENLTFASLDWFSDTIFNNFQPRLNESVITKIILLSGLSECDKDLKPSYGVYLVPKLEAIKKLLSSSLERLREAGITTTNYLDLSEMVPTKCTYCQDACYLIQVKSKASSCICVEDVCNMTCSDRNNSGMIIDLGVSVNKIENVISHLRNGEGSSTI